MANLFDLELQESHNFIHTLINNGATLELIRLRKELDEARARGDFDTAARYESHETEVGKHLKRFTELESDIRVAMSECGLTSQLAQDALIILQKQPNNIGDLSEQDKQTVQSFWIKKKACIQKLTDRHYLYDEIYAAA